MKRYYPNVIAKINKGSEPSHMSSYDCCATMESAKKHIDTLRERFAVYCSWIDDGEGHIYCMENYVNAIGTIDHEFRYYPVKGGED